MFREVILGLPPLNQPLHQQHQQQQQHQHYHTNGNSQDDFEDNDEVVRHFEQNGQRKIR
jgi:hypothetical protein